MTDYKMELEKFTYIVSHDLNAPLRHVREFGKLLVKKLGDKVSEDEREYLNFMEAGILKTESMLAGLLEVSRLTTSAEPFAEFDCNALVAELSGNFEPQINDLGAKLTLSGVPTHLFGDRTQIHTLFFHLLDNALKFSEQGVPPEIVIACEECPGEWLFSITDNGIGVPESEQLSVFDLFRKADGNDTSGIGVGLTIAQKIVQRHGGEIQIDCNQKAGSVVSFSLPRGTIEVQ